MTLINLSGYSRRNNFIFTNKLVFKDEVGLQIDQNVVIGFHSPQRRSFVTYNSCPLKTPQQILFMVSSRYADYLHRLFTVNSNERLCGCYKFIFRIDGTIIRPVVYNDGTTIFVEHDGFQNPLYSKFIKHLIKENITHQIVPSLSELVLKPVVQLNRQDKLKKEEAIKEFVEMKMRTGIKYPSSITTNMTLYTSVRASTFAGA